MFSTSPLSYAAELPAVINSMQAEAADEIVEDIVGTDDVGTVVDNGDEFIDDSGDVTTVIPKDGEGFITMEGDDIQDIGMSLPEELKTEEGVSTDDGTVVYKTDERLNTMQKKVKRNTSMIMIPSIFLALESAHGLLLEDHTGIAVLANLVTLVGTGVLSFVAIYVLHEKVKTPFARYGGYATVVSVWLFFTMKNYYVVGNQEVGVEVNMPVYAFISLAVVLFAGFFGSLICGEKKK